MRSMELHIQHKCTSQAKRLCVHRAENQTHIRSLQQRKESHRAPRKQVGDKPQIHSNWVFEFEFVVVVVVVVVCLLLKKNKEAGINLFFLIFLNCCFRSLDASGL